MAPAPRRSPLSKSRPTPTPREETKPEEIEEPEEIEDDETSADEDGTENPEPDTAEDTTKDNEDATVDEGGTGHLVNEDDENLDSITTDTGVVAKADENVVEEQLDYAMLPGAPRGETIVLGPGEPLRVSGNVEGNMIRLDKAVYRAHQPFRSLRWTFVLVYANGSLIPVSATRQIQEPQGAEPSGTSETK